MVFESGAFIQMKRYQIWEVLLGHPLEYGCLGNVLHLHAIQLSSTPIFPRTREQYTWTSKPIKQNSPNNFSLILNPVWRHPFSKPERSVWFFEVRSWRFLTTLYSESCQSDRRDTLWRHRTSADWSCDATDSENAIKWDYDT